MPNMKKAVQFGAGNIGRGFVGEFLSESGFEVVFVDVNIPTIAALQKTNEYRVIEVSDEGENIKTVNNYRAINSTKDMPSVINEISTADVVTCAVGPNILKFVAPPIAKAIEVRDPKLPPLAVIACENAINATDTLRGLIEEATPEKHLSTLSQRARFANSAIDRIVPAQERKSISPDQVYLDVKIEKFYEWVVEKTPFADGGYGELGHPDISAIHWVDNLEPFIERKLYTVNTGHATTAYYGSNLGEQWIHEALQKPFIRQRVMDALGETAELIVAKHGISREEQNNYVKRIVARISNPALQDQVARVGRNPIRKVSRKERFIGPASQLAERNMKYDNLLSGFEQALRFQNITGDDESFELHDILKSKTAEQAAEQLTGLETKHPLFAAVVRRIALVQEEMEKAEKEGQPQETSQMHQPTFWSGKWEMENGNWELGIGNWKMEMSKHGSGRISIIVSHQLHQIALTGEMEMIFDYYIFYMFIF